MKMDAIEKLRKDVESVRTNDTAHPRERHLAEELVALAEYSKKLHFLLREVESFLYLFRNSADLYERQVVETILDKIHRELSVDNPTSQ